MVFGSSNRINFFSILSRSSWLMKKRVQSCKKTLSAVLTLLKTNPISSKITRIQMLKNVAPATVHVHDIHATTFDEIGPPREFVLNRYNPTGMESPLPDLHFLRSLT